ncbi:cholecystokinin receptor-like isoform X1 [Alosa sapidissima]|uniref:cholecystokinin receptor-like isoform X1 n=2 Tax=Alosa sapidissima TaxID=34773 RepID=UPI001C0A3A10|nr:cholecystokinin receptor-like isoform X1 [Alosa sapidissima]
MDFLQLNVTVSTLLEFIKTPINGSEQAIKASVEVNNATCCNASLIPRPRAGQKEMDSVRILLYTLIFLLSVFGNLLIIAVLTLNKRMRTVTNCFLLSLAVSDLMLAVFCMPFTLIPNLLQDFIFGAAMCKIVTYFMGISVSISTFSLVAIAIERYSAICNPLKSRSWQTRSHAYKVIAATWVVSVIIMVPYPVFSQLVPFRKANNSTGHMCRLDWPRGHVEQTWYILLLLVLFLIPGVVMMIAYGLISRELYRGIQFELEQKNEASGMKNGLNGVVSPSGSGSGGTGSDESDGCYIQVPKKGAAVAGNSMKLSPLTAPPRAPERPRSNTSEAKLLAKKRVIRMLLVIVAMFFICWMPLYSVNTWKAFDLRSAHRALSGAPISLIHLLSYTSACVNPIIYCFMNKRFRKALLSTCAGCLCRRALPCPGHGAGRKGRGPDDDVTVMTTGMSKVSYMSVSTVIPP